ncbi:MAG: hypothetical protein JWP12_876 [Bacteroidetes bacterium]|nr:hypothetical protein [Bacteroidota bacterium]
MKKNKKTKQKLIAKNIIINPELDKYSNTVLFKNKMAIINNLMLKSSAA